MKLTGNQVENSTETAMNLKLESICSNLYLWVGMPSKRESITKVSNNQMRDTYWTRFSLLMSNQTSICDIIANLKNISMQKEQWGVTMTDKEKTFWENHKKKQPIRKSSSFFDCQWEIRWDKKEMWQKRKLWSKLWSGKWKRNPDGCSKWQSVLQW